MTSVTPWSASSTTVGVLHFLGDQLAPCDQVLPLDKRSRFVVTIGICKRRQVIARNPPQRGPYLDGAQPFLVLQRDGESLDDEYGIAFGYSQ